MVSLIFSLLAYFLAFVLFLLRNLFQKKVRTLPYFFLTTGLVFYLITLFERFAETKTFPIGDIYGMLSIIGNLSVLVFLVLSRRSEFELFGSVVSFAAFLTTLLLIPSREVGFKNPLYILHIMSAGIAYTSLLFAGLVSSFKLFFEKKLKEKRLPSEFIPLKILKRLEKVFVLLAFLGLTLTLIFGSVWAKIFLGTHWVNDYKLLITLVLWIYYAFLAHVYVLKLFKPHQVSYLIILGSVLGLVALLFFRHSI